MSKKFRLKNLETRISDQEKNFLDNRGMINDLKLEVEKLKTHINSLRGLVNRRVGKLFDKETKEEEDPKKDSSKNGVLVPI